MRKTLFKMKKILIFLAVLFLSTSAFSQQKNYGGGHHTSSHGGTYSGGNSGSSHKGGHYINRNTGNHYGTHKISLRMRR